MNNLKCLLCTCAIPNTNNNGITVDLTILLRRLILFDTVIIKSEDISSDFNESLEIITDGIEFIFTTFVENPFFIIKALGSPEGQELMEAISSLSKNE